uniref:Uncharacterized protein n=1 Tax=Arion vulgaris TaxID=1028688 RepID=A0A0B7B7L7_9EUPU
MEKGSKDYGHICGERIGRKVTETYVSNETQRGYNKCEATNWVLYYKYTTLIHVGSTGKRRGKCDQQTPLLLNMRNSIENPKQIIYFIEDNSAVI